MLLLFLNALHLKHSFIACSCGTDQPHGLILNKALVFTEHFVVIIASDFLLWCYFPCIQNIIFTVDRKWSLWYRISLAENGQQACKMQSTLLLSLDFCLNVHKVSSIKCLFSIHYRELSSGKKEIGEGHVHMLFETETFISSF